MEKFKDILGYEGLYRVSNLGNIISLDRVTIKSDGRVTKYKGKKLNPSLKNGYYYVNLSRDGKVKPKYIHQAIAESFMSHSLSRVLVVDHKDNDRLNNNIENLQIITQRENASKDKKNKTSKYAGVVKRGNRYYAFIRIKNKKKYLGCFINEDDAHKRYQQELKNINK